MIVLMDRLMNASVCTLDGAIVCVLVVMVYEYVMYIYIYIYELESCCVSFVNYRNTSYNGMMWAE